MTACVESFERPSATGYMEGDRDVLPDLMTGDADDTCSVACSMADTCSLAGTRKGKKERTGKALLETTDLPTACSHNQWTLQLKTKRFYMFRCMVCSKLWKTKFKTTQKCTDFFMGHCPLGHACPKPHIYSKQRKGVDVHTSLESFRGGAAAVAEKRSEGSDADTPGYSSDAASSDPGARMTKAELTGIIAAVAATKGAAPPSEPDSPGSPPPLDSPRASEADAMEPLLLPPSPAAAPMAALPYSLDAAVPYSLDPTGCAYRVMDTQAYGSQYPPAAPTYTAPAYPYTSAAPVYAAAPMSYVL
eukprot:TRINITY_DN41_c0_g1_i5.p1 TRINITY_DN41_c0_g1~~TRINITY_DN41_c0_g1_i5.p1  ORF type:complete len:303 (+),score=97.11 TRINITY_DN41_c0_g1_i5:132-1040(+)